MTPTASMSMFISTVLISFSSNIDRVSAARTSASTSNDGAIARAGRINGTFDRTLEKTVTKKKATPAPTPSPAPVERNEKKFRKSWEEYVQETTASYEHGMQPHCVPKIYENEGEYRGVVMMFHGFTACPQQMSLLAPMLASEGFIVVTPLLPGHGGNYEKAQWEGMTPAGFGGKSETKDFIELLPTHPSHWEAFGDRMRAIMALAPKDTALFGLSMGGAVASYIGSKGTYSRQLIAAPLVEFAGVVNPLVSVVEVVRKKTALGWGDACEAERAKGRAGICQFNFDVAAAARDFGSKNLERVNPSENIQALFVESDGAVALDAVFEKYKEYGLTKESTKVCGWDAAVGHSFMSPFDSPDQNKYWLDDVYPALAAYLANGTAIEHNGVFGEGDQQGWPRCKLTCTEETCRCGPEDACRWRQGALADRKPEGRTRSST